MSRDEFDADEEINRKQANRAVLKAMAERFAAEDKDREMARTEQLGELLEASRKELQKKEARLNEIRKEKEALLREEEKNLQIAISASRMEAEAGGTSQAGEEASKKTDKIEGQNIINEDTGAPSRVTPPRRASPMAPIRADAKKIRASGHSL